MEGKIYLLINRQKSGVGSARERAGQKDGKRRNHE
jgi:hypothetical protein